jgi:hypothetical protein
VAYTLYLLLVPGSASGALKVFTFYSQSLVLLTQSAQVPWPPAVRQLLHSVSDMGSLSVTAVECVSLGISVAGRYIFYAVTPLVLVTLCFAVYVVARLRGWAPAYDVLVYMSLSMLLTTYFSVTLKALAGVSCTLPDGYLNAYPWIACDASISPEFPVILALSIGSLLVYTLGVPAFAGYHLVRNRAQLTDPRIARRLGFLFGCYHPAAFWWEYVILIRRLVLSLAVTLVPFTQQPLTAVIVMVVLVASVALQHACYPFSTTLENRLELLSLYTLLLAFIGVYVAETGTGSWSWLPVLVVVGVVLVGAVLLIATVFVLLLRLLPLFTRSRCGRWLLCRSVSLDALVSKTLALRDRVLQPVVSDMAVASYGSISDA